MAGRKIVCLLSHCVQTFGISYRVESATSLFSMHSTAIVVGSLLLQHPKQTHNVRRSGILRISAIRCILSKHSKWRIGHNVDNAYGSEMAISEMHSAAQKSAKMLGTHNTHLHKMPLINPSLIYMQNFRLDTISCQRCHPVCCSMRFVAARENATNSYAN